MAYSTYISSINNSIDSFESVASEIDNLGLDSLWQGSASTKQIDNLDIISSALKEQIAAMQSVSATMSLMDRYDEVKKTLDSNINTRNNLDTKASNYSEKYQEFTAVIEEQQTEVAALKSQIETALGKTVTSYTQQFNEIPKTEVVVTSDIFNQAMEHMDKLEGAFDVSAVVSPSLPTYDGFITNPLDNPNFNNYDAWVGENPYSWSGLYGQCTWFAWGKFYELYGFSPGFTGNGKDCAGQLVNAHSDKFYLSDTPVVGAVFSIQDYDGYGHTGVVVGVDYENNTITIQDGNYNGKTDSFSVAQSDWGTLTYNLDEFNNKRDGTVYANPY